MTVRVGAAAAVLVVSSIASASAAGVRDAEDGISFEVSPAHVLVDQPVRVRVTGLRPGQEVTLEASTEDTQAITWRARAAVRADRAGVVDTRGAMKLFWSMRPVGKFEAPPAFMPQLRDSTIRLSAFIGTRRVASGRVLRDLEAPDVAVRELTLAGDGLVGSYLAKPDRAPAPAVLQLGGSLGGHSSLPAGLLASHGFPTLSLAYFGEDRLPSTLRDIPLEYFARALA